MPERVPGGIMEVSRTRMAAGFLQDASAALARGDLGEYTRLIKFFAEGFAESGVPYYYLDTFRLGLGGGGPDTPVVV